MVRAITDPDRRSRAYVAVRDAGTEQELTRYGDYLRTIGGDLAKQMDLDAFREKADSLASRIPDMTTRLKAVKAVAQAGDIPTLRKLIDRAEEILKEQNDTRIWTDERYMGRKLMEFLENGDWEKEAELLREELKGQYGAETNEFLIEDGHTDVASANNQVKIARSALQNM